MLIVLCFQAGRVSCRKLTGKQRGLFRIVEPLRNSARSAKCTAIKASAKREAPKMLQLEPQRSARRLKGCNRSFSEAKAAIGASARRSAEKAANGLSPKRKLESFRASARLKSFITSAKLKSFTASAKLTSFRASAKLKSFRISAKLESFKASAGEAHKLQNVSEA